MLKRIVFGGLTAASMAVSSIVRADPPPARPDYLFRLPEREWVVSHSLWRPAEPCETDHCEAGWHDGDMVLSIRRGNDFVEIVGGMRGCRVVSYRTAPLDPNAVDAASIASTAGSVAEDVYRNCAVAPRGIGAPPVDALLSDLLES